MYLCFSHMNISMNKTQHQAIKYLENLSKEEIIDLIIKLAPPSFFDNINTKFSSTNQGTDTFEKISNNINLMFDDELLLYNPKKFEDKLFKQLEKLRGLWDKLPLEIGDLIISIMQDIENAFEDGYLYIEHYQEEDEYFESEAINQYIVDFANNLSPDNQCNFLSNLKEILDCFGYSTFSSIEKKLF